MQNPTSHQDPVDNEVRISKLLTHVENAAQYYGRPEVEWTEEEWLYFLEQNAGVAA